MQSFDKDNNKSSSGVQVFKRTRTKLPPIRKSLAILLVSLQGKYSTGTVLLVFELKTYVLYSENLKLLILCGIIIRAGTNVVIELKNDAEVTGILEDTDPEMNVTMSNATQVLSDGSSVTQESITVKGHSIRYVHIPPNIRMRSHLSDYIRKIDRIRSSNQPRSIKDKPKPVLPDASDRQDIILSKDT